MSLPTYDEYIRETDPARALAMATLVAHRPNEYVGGWPENITTAEFVDLAKEVLNER